MADARSESVRLGQSDPSLASVAFGRSTGTDVRVRLIVEAAARQFEENGFHGTSMQDIASDVGITKAALYHYFSSKEDLLYLVHDAFISTMLESAEEFVAEHPDPAEQLPFFVSEILRTIAEYRPYVRAFFQDMNVISGEAHADVMDKRERYERLVESCLEQGQQQGIFAPDIPPRLGALYLFGACNWAYQWYDSKGEMSVDRLADLWTRLVRNGLADQ